MIFSGSHRTPHCDSAEVKSTLRSPSRQLASVAVAPCAFVVRYRSLRADGLTAIVAIFEGRYTPSSFIYVVVDVLGKVVLATAAKVEMSPLSEMLRKITLPSREKSASYVFGINVFVIRPTAPVAGSALHTFPLARSTKRRLVVPSMNPMPAAGAALTRQSRGGGGVVTSSGFPSPSSSAGPEFPNGRKSVMPVPASKLRFPHQPNDRVFAMREKSPGEV